MSIAKEIYKEISKVPIVDIHTHVDFRNPFAKNAWQILSYHYFTEMAHSMGMTSGIVASSRYTAQQKIQELCKYLPAMETTEPYGWLMYLSKKLFNFPYPHLGQDNYKSFMKCVKKKADTINRLQELCRISNIEIISTTNLPWENLDGIEKYKNSKGKQLFIPTFRIDLLLQAGEITVKNLGKSTGRNISTLKDYENAIVKRVDYFIGKGAKSFAVSLKTNPLTMHVDKKDAEKILLASLKKGRLINEQDSLKLSAYVLDFLAGLCKEYKLPFQLMVGAEKMIYPTGVPGGEDVFQPNGSLLGLVYILKKYPNVKFPISVLSATEDKELAVYARIFPNVYASGHWWFENTYESIKTNLKNRLKLSPHKKMLGQYSDAYTSELIGAKIDMYKRALSKVLGEYIESKIINEQTALGIAKHLLYNGPKEIFRL